ASINFITAHDGFTLEDLVSYEEKHNEANLEDNRDGESNNHSVNCGVEGASEDHDILLCRETLKRGLMATLFLSQGVPMLLGGDELSKTQRGNNNTYAQDNDLNWYDWDLDARKEAFLSFMKQIIAFRKAHPSFRRRNFLTGEGGEGDYKDVSWWHARGHEMTPEDWTNPELPAFGMLLYGDSLKETDALGRPLTDDTFLVLFSGQKTSRFTLPPTPHGETWEKLWITAPDQIRRQPLSEPGSVVSLKPRLVTVYCAAAAKPEPARLF
ncbi:MAG: glycogen debranching enzyme GlgX, partial [Deinococcota bacterium]|nr:glycogen debranching enzyme GlgX [Deinococcota bacterium]